jgi:KUP system potassium uptake protein
MLITTVLVTLVMVMLWNLPLPISLLFFCFFGLVEGAYLTSVLNKVLEGGWVPFALSLSILAIMLSWIHGRAKKREYEASRRVSGDELMKLLCDEGAARVPGVCLFYSDLADGISPLVRHYARCAGTLHQFLVLVTIHQVPVPSISADKRFLVDSLAYKKGVYRSGQRKPMN